MLADMLASDISGPTATENVDACAQHIHVQVQHLHCPMHAFIKDRMQACINAQ